MFDETHKWLILGQKLNSILSLLNDDAFSVVTDIVIAIETITGFDLYDVYNPCKARGGSLNVTALGYWTEKSGVVIRLKQPKYERRSNLHGMKIRVGVLVSNRLAHSEYGNWQYNLLIGNLVATTPILQFIHGRYRVEPGHEDEIRPIPIPVHNLAVHG